MKTTIEQKKAKADWICIAGGFGALVVLSLLEVYGFSLPLPALPLLVILLTLIGILIAGDQPKKLLHLEPCQPTKPLRFSGYFILMFISMFAANFLTQFAGKFFNIELPPQPLVVEAGSGSWLDFSEIVLTAFVFAPIAEELYFRGALFRRLNAVLPPFLSVGITALLFAAIHANIQTMASLLIMSIFLSREYLRTNSVQNCILLHACNNLIAVIQILIIRLSA